jgi:F-type H+-transporting ATPase subunit delta
LSRVSIRYARALFSLAQEGKKLDTVADDLDGIKSLLVNSSDFSSFVDNPLLSSSKQSEVVNELFSGKVDKLTSDFLELICRKKRLNQLVEIILAFDSLLLDQRNQVHAEVTSASVLDDQQMDDIRSNLEAMTQKSVILNTKKDKGLIGGFKVLIDGVIIDSSVKYQLAKLKEKLVS